MSKRQKRFTRKEKIKLSKRLGQDLKGKSDTEIRQILEGHDEKMPGLEKWLGISKCAA